jgi:hypothetical protein
MGRWGGAGWGELMGWRPNVFLTVENGVGGAVDAGAGTTGAAPSEWRWR